MINIMAHFKSFMGGPRRGHPGGLWERYLEVNLKECQMESLSIKLHIVMSGWE
jgi:hypothetical protein